uniref:melanoma-associated antigen B4-like n=1 Tax=Jaculus jaculus TaxID=51337 RepID=UPI0003333FFB|nr:melanoma-associated antigen B4-like [Jaculus jaculus]
MPRGQKSKARAREKRRQVQKHSQGFTDVQGSAAEEVESPSHSVAAYGDAVPSTSATDVSQMSKRAMPTTIAGKDIARKTSGKSFKGRREENAKAASAFLFTESPKNNLLVKKTGMLIQYLLYKHKMKEPITKGGMLKVINKRFKGQFAEILNKASERIQLVFGLEVKEVKPNSSLYTLLSKLDPGNASLVSGVPFPQNGLLLPVLSVIFLNGNCASEEEMWQFLNILGIYDGISHFIFGDVRNVITQDLVQEKYLVYRQVAKSDPFRYEFLWGPRAYAETSKMKVLEFLAKVNETIPRAFPSYYEEALREEEERALVEVTARCGTKAKGKAKCHT